MIEHRIVTTDELSERDGVALRALLAEAFDGAFFDNDWDHAVGGWHVLAHDVGRDGEIVAHAAVVERVITVGDRALRAGYVEAVATVPNRQGRGFGRGVMTLIGDLVAEHFEVGFLSTGAHGFYEPLGWRRWRGPTYVLRSAGRVPTADEDDGIMVLRTTLTAGLDLREPVCCEERSGDDW